MENLSSPVILGIFEYLNLYELLPLLQVSKSFNTICRSDHLWRKACNLLSPVVISDYYSHFLRIISDFQIISNAMYDIMSVAKSTHHGCLYKSLLSSSNPRLVPILSKYHHLPSGNNKFSEYSDLAPPTEDLLLEYYWLYLLYNGQTSGIAGLFGSYEFYDVNVKLVFQPAKPIGSILELASSRNGEALVIFMDLTNKIGKGKGAVFCNSGVAGTVLYLATSLTSYLQAFSYKLKNNQIRFIDEQISLYEYGNYSSENSKNGIKITAAALYVPHFSAENRYLWSYQVTISADNPTEEWKLTTRTWKIEDSNGEVQVVDRQPGVIGLYPQITQISEPTVYTSCAYLKTTSGVMSGFFSFKKIKKPNETIDVEVLPFRLELPPGAELVDVRNLQ